MANPNEILATAYAASLAKEGSFIQSADLRDKLEFICRCTATKGPIRFLMACLLAKIHNPEIDIRKPYTEINDKDVFSGRGYDEDFVEPLIFEHGLPCNATTAFLSPVFRNIDKPLNKDFVLIGRPRKPYELTVDVLDSVATNGETSENLLNEILRFLIVIKAEDAKRMEELVASLKQEEAMFLSSEEIITLLTQHLECKNSSRLPVLIVASAYQTVSAILGERFLPLNAHNAADKQTGSIGDVEITLMNDDGVITSYEMKDKRVTKSDIDHCIQKLKATDHDVDNYIFITTDVIEPEVVEYAKTFYNRIGIEIAVLDCIGFIRHFLHFFHRQRSLFLDTYQEMVLSEPASSVSQVLKEAFLALRRAAETEIQ